VASHWLEGLQLLHWKEIFKRERIGTHRVRHCTQLLGPALQTIHRLPHSNPRRQVDTTEMVQNTTLSLRIHETLPGLLPTHLRSRQHSCIPIRNRLGTLGIHSKDNLSKHHLWKGIKLDNLLTRLSPPPPPLPLPQTCLSLPETCCALLGTSEFWKCTVRNCYNGMRWAGWKLPAYLVLHLCFDFSLWI